MTTQQPHREPLDDIDRRIVAELSQDGRLSVRTLAERVHVSRTAAHNRLQALQRRGVISGFGAQIDRKAIGLEISALVVVRVGDVPWEQIVEQLATLPFVEKVQAVSGDIDIILTVSAPDHEQLSQAILRDIHDMPGVVSTRSHLILAEIEGRPPAQSLDIWRS
ncbi:Lrp/AsnC family transcriptional regulator [Agromyces mediolanus]|uniref:Transcriptional regulator, AsnC family protein n=1 Tax=Agromyces mediolanus TaxID=41986 RepID=A0A918CI14_AGRME|nr:Lrp/AsnC family transcriptional regulator [Agromyces mediolanus]GGR25362.1 putative transcriptional regulator, AsnC family protein [Agromyces mediolanus]GLJ70813.1 putative transcriptional regulator, AsnC family protein [Agromyces mediolanus]